MLNKENVKENAYSALGKIVEVFAWLCRNQITVSNNEELFTLPVIAFAAAIIFVPVVLPAIIISLCCGVEYTVSGEDFPAEHKISFR